MEKAKRARKVETPKRPSPHLRSSAPALYSTPFYVPFYLLRRGLVFTFNHRRLTSYSMPVLTGAFPTSPFTTPFYGGEYTDCLFHWLKRQNPLYFDPQKGSSITSLTFYCGCTYSKRKLCYVGMQLTQVHWAYLIEYTGFLTFYTVFTKKFRKALVNQ